MSVDAGSKKPHQPQSLLFFAPGLVVLSRLLGIERNIASRILQRFRFSHPQLPPNANTDTTGSRLRVDCCPGVPFFQ